MCIIIDIVQYSIVRTLYILFRHVLMFFVVVWCIILYILLLYIHLFGNLYTHILHVFIFWYYSPFLCFLFPILILILFSCVPMLLEVSELFEEVIEEQLKMAEREVPPMFRRWFSDGQQAENMLRYMKWDDGIMGQCFIFMFRIICLKGCFIFKPWKWRSWDEMAIMG